MCEQIIVEKFIEGDIVSFEKIFKNYARELYFIALGMCAEPAVAKDCVQDGFMHLWEHRKRLDPEQNVSNYLRTIVRNNALNYLRYKNIRKRHEKNIANELQFRDGDDTSDIEKKITAIRSAIDELPDGCKRAFIMAVIDGMSYVDAAESLGVSVNTVKSQVRIGYQKIRQAVDSIDEEDLLPIIFLSFFEIF